MHPLALSVALALSWAPGALSQILPQEALVAPPPSPGLFPVGEVLMDHAVDGTVWAAAATWKAGFAANGTTFLPYLGSELPSAPATFRLREVRCGGLALELAAAAPDQTGQRVRFARGGVVEFYDLSPAGIEQQFAFAALPARGELRLELEVATALVAEPDGAGWYFRGPYGGLRYGAAVAIDAAGARCEVACERTGDGLRLVVPEWFVAKACLPLCIDPMIGSSVPFGAGTVVLSNTDIAYDHSRGEYCVSYERAYSATDHDVYVARLDASMNYLGLSAIDTSTQYWSKPHIAGLEAHDVMCVVAEYSAIGVSPITVVHRYLLLGNPPVVQAPYSLGFVAFGDYLTPVIGGDSDPVGPSTFVVVWAFRNNFDGTSRIGMANRGSDGTVWFGANLVYANSVERNPVISKTCGDRNGNSAAWSVVYRSEDPATGLGQLRAAIVRRAGPSLVYIGSINNFAVGGSILSLGQQWAVSSPTDHDSGRRFLCVERPGNLLPGNAPVVGHLFDSSGALLQSGASLASNSTDNRQPAVDSDGIRFAVAHTVRFSATDADLRCSTVGIVGNQLLVQDQAAPSFNQDYDSNAAICAARGAVRGLYGLAFTRSSGANEEVRAQVYAGVATAGGTGLRNTGCGGLASTSSGLPWLGQSMTFTLGDSSGLPGFVVGFPVSQPLGACPGCTQGVSGQTLLGAQATVAIPPNAAFVGITLAAQGFRFAPSGLPCLGQLQLGNTHDFTIR